jgi:glycosyltransferase involved in cell wall biosynthesis
MKRIFVLYPYYWPDFSAGGPVQSIFNLVNRFSGTCQFFLASKVSQQESANAKTFKLNKWNTGPHGEQVYMSESLSFLKVFSLLWKTKPDTVYINGIFTAVTTLPGLLYAAVTGTKAVISPRGMLQVWALKKKGWKKILYLPVFKLLTPRALVWHATNEAEEMDIRLVFGLGQRITVASNIPRKPADKIMTKARIQQEPLKLVFLSLINSNKNLGLIIDSVNSLPKGITLDIYGPIADKKYWNFCYLKIAGSSRIQYKGVVSPELVQEVLSHYHFFILPTLGENFGHAIFDALSIGLPVIISRHTPWSEVESMNAGYYCDELNSTSLNSLLTRVMALSTEDYNSYSLGALEYARQYIASHNYAREYNFLME